MSLHRKETIECPECHSIEKSPKSFNTERGRKFRDIHVYMVVSSCALGSVFGDTVYGAFGGAASFCAVFQR